MTDEQSVYRRVLRRETHSARTVPAVIVAALLLLCVLATVGAAIWALVDPSAQTFLQRVGAEGVRAVSAPGGRALVAGIAVVLGILLVVLAVAPGRRARRGRVAPRAALLVDEGVLADAAATSVAARCDLPRSQVVVEMRSRRTRVRIRPFSGLAVDRIGAAQATTTALSDLGFGTTPAVVVAEKGVLS